MNAHTVLEPIIPTSAPPQARLTSIFGALGVAWNLFGVVQLAESLRSTPESLMAMGMTAAQAATMTSYPAWMSVGFAVGAIGGLVGSALLWARHRLATSVLLASLVGYVVLFVGDITEGVFAALGAPQVMILSMVVAIACGLWAWARRVTPRA